MAGLKLQQCIDRYNWIRRTLADGIPLICSEIAERIHCTPKTAQRYINRMRKDGYEVWYNARLRGFVIEDQREPSLPDTKDLLLALRHAYAWARLNSPSAPWINDAEKALSKFE